MSTTAENTIRTTEDLYRAERELAAIAERTNLGQRIESDDVSERILRRVAADARERLEGARTDVPAAPIILVTTGHPTLHQHPGRDGEDVHPRLGRLLQPRHLSSVELTAAAGIPWAADNDCFQGLDEAAFVKMIDRLAGLPGCLFVTVPDVVGDHDATLESFGTWAPELERRGLPLGFVAQDGATPAGVPWDRIAALFIGGSNDFKLGPAAARLAREAKARGKWVHWGRVNTRRRFDLIVATGAADSFDGSKWARWRKTYLPAGLTWLDEALEMRAAALEVDRRGLAKVAGASPDAPASWTDLLEANAAHDRRRAEERVECRRLELELAVLTAFDENRREVGHDYGSGQRAGELNRRRAEIKALGGDQWPDVELLDDDVTADDLRAALEAIVAPREARVRRETYRAGTPATRRTVRALELTREHVETVAGMIDVRVIRKAEGLTGRDVEVLLEVADEPSPDRAAPPRMRLTISRLRERGLVRRDRLEVTTAGAELAAERLSGEIELDPDAVAGLSLDRQGAGRSIDLVRGSADDVAGGFPWLVITDGGPAGRMTSPARSREEGIALAKAADLEHRGERRLAAIARALAGELRSLADGIDTADDGATGRRRIYRDALRAYRTDAELERAERLSSAQDYTDGGGPVDDDGRRIV